MTKLPNGITYLNEIPLAETIPLEQLSEDLGLSLEKLLTKIIRLNSEGCQIELYTHITKHTVEFDKWFFEDDKRMQQSSAPSFMFGDETTHFIHQPNGLFRLNADHKLELSMKESINLIDIWSNDIEYISLTRPIEVLRKRLLISTKHSQRLTSEITPTSSPIKDPELIEYVKNHYPENPQRFLEDVLKLKKENEDLNDRVKELENFTCEEEPQNKHNLYGIIAGLLTILSEDNASSYLTGTKKPNVDHISKRITQIAASEAMLISNDEAIRKVIRNAHKQLNRSNNRKWEAD